MSAPDNSIASSAALLQSIDDRKTRKLGYSLIIMFLAVFIFWGSIAPLKSAAIAAGTVSVAGNKKIVQHATGGTVANIYIKEGDSVVAGQVVVSLDDSDAKTELRRSKKQTLQLVAELSRWQAERAQLSKVENDSWYATLATITGETSGPESCDSKTAELSAMRCEFDLPNIKSAIDEQQNILNARLAVYNSTLESMRYKITETQYKEKENQSKLNNILQKRQLTATELKRYRYLEKQGLITRQKVFELESDLSDINRSYNEIGSALKIAKDQSARLKSELLTIQNTQTKTASENFVVTRNKLDVVIAEMRRARNTMDRLEIRSPINGTVIGTQVNTIGSVIAPGDTLMEIVPGNATLLIESQVNTSDRDSVSIGQIAQVRFSAFDRRSSKPTLGKVSLISADSVIDPTTNTPFYKTIIELTEDPSVALNGAQIFPGMQADVLIETGEQTFIQYLFSPIANSFRHAFRES